MFLPARTGISEPEAVSETVSVRSSATDSPLPRGMLAGTLEPRELAVPLITVTLLLLLLVLLVKRFPELSQLPFSPRFWSKFPESCDSVLWSSLMIEAAWWRGMADLMMGESCWLT